MDVVKENSSLAVESDSVSSHGPEASIPTTVKEAVKGVYVNAFMYTFVLYDA